MKFNVKLSKQIINKERVKILLNHRPPSKRVFLHFSFYLLVRFMDHSNILVSFLRFLMIFRIVCNANK